jgi:hypothetical protein
LPRIRRERGREGEREGGRERGREGRRRRFSSFTHVACTQRDDVQIGHLERERERKRRRRRRRWRRGEEEEVQFCLGERGRDSKKDDRLCPTVLHVACLQRDELGSRSYALYRL